MQFLLQILKLHKKYICQVVFTSLFYSIFSIICSYYFKFIIDGLTLGNTKSYLFLLFILFLFITILKLISDLFRNYLLVYLNEKIDMLLTNYIFKNIIFLPYNYYRNHTTGEIVSRMNDLSKVREMISKVILLIFIDLPLSIISFILLYFINSKLFFISIIILIVYLFVILIFTSIFDNYIKKVQSLKADYTSYMVESITGFETVKGIRIENNIINKFQNKFINYLEKIFKFETLYNKQHFIKESIYDIGILVIILFGSFLILENKLTIGSLIVFNSLFGYLIFPFKNLIENIIVFKEAKHSLYRILETINPSANDKKISKKLLESIDIKNLNYSYNDRDLILKNINLKIKSKDKIMIIGNSGSGKSTLVKLIMQYYKVNRDKIIIDGIDINDYSNESIKNNIIYISQNETLFTDTLYNNVNLENIVDDETFYDVAKLCYVDEIIKNNNLGYNMLLEENGFNLSGGEKQRIVLARALCRNFNVLIIDEGLNQIDIDLERKILKNILNKYKDKTVIVISHRLENMDLFNRVIEFSNHKIKKDVCKCMI